MAEETYYDVVAYPPGSYRQSHPDRLATLATLLGMDVAPVGACRVLEVGCGDGSNLIPMAVGLPGSEFFGVDLAAAPIARGNAVIAAAGLGNVRLEALDLMAFPEDAGTFEYIVAHGNPNVMLCERGIRTFETETRNTCDISAVPVLNNLTHLPVILDPSHAVGKRSLVPPLARAGVAIGADGMIVETHPCPEKAWSDGAQSLTLEQFRKMMKDLAPYIALWKASRMEEAVLA